MEMTEDELWAVKAWMAAYIHLYNQMLENGMWSIDLDGLRAIIDQMGVDIGVSENDAGPA